MCSFFYLLCVLCDHDRDVYYHYHYHAVLLELYCFSRWSLNIPPHASVFHVHYQSALTHCL